MTPTGFQHPECYARALGGCSYKVSGEHYISKSILELVEHSSARKSKVVRTFGLAFQKPGEDKHFGVASLVGNILCETHNSRLSPYDVAGRDMFLALEALNDAAGKTAVPQRRIRVDGDGLERWMLKSMIGGLYCGAFRVAEKETMKGVCPPDKFPGNPCSTGYFSRLIMA